MVFTENLVGERNNLPITLVVQITIDGDLEIENFLAGNDGKKMEMLSPFLCKSAALICAG